MEFKDRLKNYRAENNLTQEELAEKLFVSRQAISKYETGRSYPSYEVMVSVATLLGITVDELISKEELAKETINTAEQTRKNKRSLFILLALLIGGIIISVIAIVLSILSAGHTAPTDTDGWRMELAGMVATIDEQTPTIKDLTDDKMAGYCILREDDISVGTSYNVSALDIRTTDLSNYYEMTVTCSAKQRYLNLYEIYFDGETGEYVFEESSKIDLEIINKIDFEFERDGFTWRFVFNFKKVDTLLEMKLYEYGINGERLSETLYDGEADYTISPDCLYLVVEEKLEDTAGHVYFNRAVIYNSEIDKLYFYPIKHIYENGFGSDSLLICKY